jgi:AP2 domain
MTPQEQEYREIQLSGPEKYIVKIDTCDYDYLSQFNWRPLRVKGKVYAVRHTPVVNKSKRKEVLMHREILGLGFGDKRQGDHALQDTLDNRKLVNGVENLRIASHLENTWNSVKKVYNKSGFKGVSEEKKGSPNRRWRARITVNGKEVRLGSFPTREEASKSYDEASIKYFGRFARSK